MDGQNNFYTPPQAPDYYGAPDSMILARKKREKRELRLQITFASCAVLSLVLTDEGDVGKLSAQLIGAGFSVSFNPLSPKEHIHVD